MGDKGKNLVHIKNVDWIFNALWASSGEDFTLK